MPHEPTPFPPTPISDVAHLVAVVTGAGSGMGAELTTLLASQGCSVAICDLDPAAIDATLASATEAAIAGEWASARFTGFVADVADETQMHAFANHVRTEFGTESINLLFNNAGIGGAGSFVQAPDQQWDRVFGVCWGGVLNGCRAFRTMLLAAERGQIINTSSINGMWACLGPTGPHSAYSAAKFAVRGFTEALNVDFRVNAPHLTAAVVMPGHIGTKIMLHSFEQMGMKPDNLSDADITEIRTDLGNRGVDTDALSDDELRQLTALRIEGFEHHAPTTAREAAQSILDGVRSGQWRILVGDDAVALDGALRHDPDAAYSDAFAAALGARGHFEGLIV